ncbi:MAG: DNA polymerase III subunit beta [Candidatus Dojkabacteria bacterium]|nr:MAG: DNA polymerase III subunit beta [Candidatus Dojkabacteria bacterium]
MRFRINAEIFASYINLVSKVVSSKANLPVLSNILLDVEKNKVTVIGTDLDVQISAATALSADDEGKVTINAKLFSQYINTVPKEESIEVLLDKNTLFVTSQSGSASFSTRDAEEFPLFETNDLEVLCDIPRETFITMVDKTIFACAKDDIRPILTGVNIEVDAGFVTMVALDTFRLSKISVPIKTASQRKQIVISSEALDHASRIMKDAFVSSTAENEDVIIKLSATGNYCVIEYGDVQVYARLIEGDFPEYKQAIPAAHQIEISLEKQKLIDSLKRVGVFAQSAISQRVIMGFEKGQLTMEANVPEVGEVKEVMPVKMDGEPLRIAFQLKFLLDILSHIEDDTVILKAINKNAAGVFYQPTMETFLHLMMPLKLDD